MCVLTRRRKCSGQECTCERLLRGIASAPFEPVPRGLLVAVLSFTAAGSVVVRVIGFRAEGRFGQTDGSDAATSVSVGAELLVDVSGTESVLILHFSNPEFLFV